MSMLTRRRFCEIVLAAPMISARGFREPYVNSDNLKRIGQVENSLMELRDGKAVRVNVALPERMQQQHVPGLSIAVIDNYEIAWTKGYGVLEEGMPTLVTGETLFAAGSISKPVSTAAALKLVEEGRLKLDEDVNDKLRSWKVPENEFTKTEKVTLRRLLSHSAGLSGGGAPSFAVGEERITILQTLDASPPTNSGTSDRAAEPVRVQAIPGSRFLYSPGGFAILTLLIEDVERKSFATTLQDTVLRPLGMKSSTFSQPLPHRFVRRATTEHDSGQPLDEKRRYFPSLAAGGLWTTPTDLARFVAEIMLCWLGKSHKILTSQSVREMLTCQIGDCKSQGGQGLGFGIQNPKGQLCFAHQGRTYGSACLLFAYPHIGRGAVVMANDTPGGDKLVMETMFAIAAVYDWPW